MTPSLRRSVGDVLETIGTWPTDTVAFVDAEWLAGTPLDAAVLVLLVNGSELTFGERRFAATSAASPEVLALAALLEVADDAVQLALTSSPGPVTVTGRGIIAELVRRRLPTASPEPSPAVIVDTTGDAETIAQAASDLADGGTLIVAGELAGRALPMNLYTDVHRRGLLVTGAQSLLGSFPSAAAQSAAADMLPGVAPRYLESGRSLPADGWRWSRFAPSAP